MLKIRRIFWGISAIAALSLLVLVVLRFGYPAEWTGFGEDVRPKTKDQDLRRAKTLWDWLQLLIVPAALAIGGYFFTRSERKNEQHIAEQRRQDDTLQAYLDGMSQLLTDKDRPLHRAQVGDSLSTVARARTLTVLARLDGERKRSVLQFMYEAGLVNKNRPIVNLHRADLSRADLHGTDLEGTDLSVATLGEADLSVATLRGANLSWATLGGAVANLSGANLSGANLSKATITDEQLAKAKLSKDTTMPDGRKYEDLLKDKEERSEGKNKQ